MSFFEITGEDYLNLLTRRLRGELGELVWLQQCRELMAPHLPGQPSILDIGCATGYAYNSFKQLNPRYLGIDVEEKFLEIARAYFPKDPNIAFLYHDIHSAPLSPKLSPPADLVICSAIIEHFPSLFPALQNIAATVGRYLFLRTFLSENEQIHSIPSPVSEFAATHRKFSNSYSLNSVLSYLAQNGFKVKTVRDRYTDSMPYWIDDAVRIFYIVIAERINGPTST